MSELSINFVNRIIPQLRSQASSAGANLNSSVRRLLTESTELQLATLNQILQDVNGKPELLNYWLALFVNRAKVEAPLGQGLGLQAFQHVDYFLQLQPGISREIWSVYAPGLMLEISQSTGETLVQWANLLIEYKDVEEIRIPIGWLGVMLKSEIAKSLVEFQKTPTAINSKRMVEKIELALNFNSEMKEIINFVVEKVLKYLISSNDFDDFYKQINEKYTPDLPKAAEILKNLEEIKDYFSKKNQKKIAEIQEKLVSLTHKKVFKKSFDPEDLITSAIDLQSITYQDRPIYEHSFKDHSVRVYSGRNSDGYKIIVKQYHSFSPDFDYTNIVNEGKIMTFLSNRANTLKTFIKLYCIYRDNSQIYFYMEDGGDNLMNFLTEKKRSNTFVELKIIVHWIITLLESFSWLNTNRINHCDIKPHNILVNPLDLSIKIIDFSVGHFTKDNEATISPTVAHPIQGTDGYMSPELIEALEKGHTFANYKPGKSDVFSLGLTFLQMITLEKLSGYNSIQLNPNLLAKVDGLNVPKWIKSLLNGMLQSDRRKRLSFTKCLKFIPNDETTKYN